MSQLENTTSDWLEFINSDHSKNLLTDNLSFCKQSTFHKLFIDSDVSEFAPFKPCATEEYLKGAREFSTSGSAPISVYDGLQTTLNICRAKSGYNPLDQEQENDPAGKDRKGSAKYFIAFTNLIAGVPFLTLDWAESTYIDQKSHNADEIINSFLKGFKGIQEKDQQKIRDSIVDLVKAALSYAKKTQKKSIFTQNIFTVDDKGKELEKVTCTIYSSTFEISQTKDKGGITYHSNYQLGQASYSLSKSTWDRIKDQFSNKEKETVDDWINDMTTPVDKHSKVKALCLEN